jgi:hypothetical protein
MVWIGKNCSISHRRLQDREMPFHGLTGAPYEELILNVNLNGGFVPNRTPCRTI